MNSDWSVYLVKCADGSLYCGVTNNLDRRIKQHNQGIASKYTRSRLPVILKAVRRDLTKQEAFRLEFQIKRLPAKKKIPALEFTSLS